jgi:hypothetical protein
MVEGNIGGDDPYGQIVSSFVASGNRVAAYDVAEALQSRFAPPLPLLSRIQGETTMGWTGPLERFPGSSKAHVLPEEYRQTKLLRERASFSCAVDGI